MGFEIDLLGGLGVVVSAVVMLGNRGAAYFVLLDYPGEDGRGVDVLDLPWLGFWV